MPIQNDHITGFTLELEGHPEAVARMLRAINHAVERQAQDDAREARRVDEIVPHRAFDPRRFPPFTLPRLTSLRGTLSVRRNVGD